MTHLDFYGLPQDLELAREWDKKFRNKETVLESQKSIKNLIDYEGSDRIEKIYEDAVNQLFPAMFDNEDFRVIGLPTSLVEVPNGKIVAIAAKSMKIEVMDLQRSDDELVDSLVKGFKEVYEDLMDMGCRVWVYKPFTGYKVIDPSEPDRKYWGVFTRGGYYCYKGEHA